MAAWEYAPLKSADKLPAQANYRKASVAGSRKLEVGCQTVMVSGGTVSKRLDKAFKFKRDNQHALAFTPGYVILRPVDKKKKVIVCRRISQEVRFFRLSSHLDRPPITSLMALDCFDKNTNDLVMTIYANPDCTVTWLKKEIIRRLTGMGAASPQAKIGFEMEYPGRMKVSVIMAAMV